MRTTFKEWYEALDSLGCSSDPIEVEGLGKTDVSTFYYGQDALTDVAGFKIGYYDGFKRRWVQGTCLSMLRERRRPQKKIKKALTPQLIIEAAETDLDSQGRHAESIVDQWNAIRRFIAPEKQFRAAIALAKSMRCPNWLKFVD